jgi:hypothetical protein
MEHHRAKEFDRKLKRLFDETDDYLEDSYGDRYTLHPARAERGGTANKASDGLFNVGASFSAGYGSEHGRGYVIDVDMVTLREVPDEVEEEIEEAAVRYIRRRLSHYFPERDLKVERDGRTFKIIGDFRLGTV